VLGNSHQVFIRVCCAEISQVIESWLYNVCVVQHALQQSCALLYCTFVSRFYCEVKHNRCWTWRSESRVDRITSTECSACWDCDKYIQYFVWDVLLFVSRSHYTLLTSHHL